MANVEKTTSWQHIQEGVKEAERLIVRKEYNMVMVKARQTLEYMVRCMAERACLVEGDLSDTIDQLYEGKWIDKATRDNYHTIRTLGNKAVHEGHDSAYDANRSYQLLTQEVYAFAHEFTGNRTSRPVSVSSRQTSIKPAPSRQTSSARSSGGASSVRQSTGKNETGTRKVTSVSGTTSTRNTSALRSSSAQTRTVRTTSSKNRTGQQRVRQSSSVRRRKKRFPVPYTVLRILIPVLIVILLVVIIRVFLPDNEEKVQETMAQPQQEVMTEAPESEPAETEPLETEPETEEEVQTWVVTGSSVNVRAEPSTSARVLTQLTRGTQVDYVKRYNNDWAVINYDGQEAYISSQYIEMVEEGDTQ